MAVARSTFAWVLDRVVGAAGGICPAAGGGGWLGGCGGGHAAAAGGDPWADGAPSAGGGMAVKDGPPVRAPVPAS